MSKMNKDQCLRLISLYKENSYLWDPSDPFYSNKDLRRNAWANISDEMGVPAESLRKKMVSLMGCHRREKWRERKSREEESGGVYKSNWFAYDAFAFMPERRMVTRKRKATKSTEESDSEDDEADEGDDERTTLDIKQEPRDETSSHVEPKIHTRRKLTRGPVNPPRVVEVRRDEVRREELSRDEKDECDSFGEYIAMSLRKHDRRTRATMKQAINNIIFELEMKKYGEPAAVDVNPL